MKALTLKMPPNGHGQDQHAGQRGDHRMHKLIVPLPRSTLKKIQSCIVLFLLDDKTPIRSDLITWKTEGDITMSGNHLHVVLWQKVTLCRALRIQVACYGDEDGQIFINNTPISERILFRRSLHGSLNDMPEVSDSPGILTQLLAWMHNHPNQSVLDALSDEDGALFYDGLPVGEESTNHDHHNKPLLDALSSSGGGVLAYDDNDLATADELLAATTTPLSNEEINNLIDLALQAIQ